MVDLLHRSRRIPETKADMDLQIGKNYNYNVFELILTIGKNKIMLKRSEFLKEIKLTQREFEHKSKVIWEDVLIVGGTQ